MNNSWLQFLIPKEFIKVSNLHEISELRAQKVSIYGVERVADGYLVCVRKGSAKEVEIVKTGSIYKGLLSFVIPAFMVWLGLLGAVNSVTIDYEIRGNLPQESLLDVEHVLEGHFIQVGNFSFLRSNAIDVEQSIKEIFHDYLWMDIKTEGNLLVISIYDTQVSQNLEDENVTDTLYAKYSGIITAIDVASCRVLISVGDVVRQGEALVSCYTPIGYADEVAPIEGSAYGDVYAEVWWELSIEFPVEYTVNLLTINSVTQWFINLGNNRFNVWGDDPLFEYVEPRTVIFNPLQRFGLSPFTLERVQSYEKRDIIIKNDVDLIMDATRDMAIRQIEELIEGQFNLITLDFLSVEEMDQLVRLVYHATVQQNIAQ